MNTSLFSVRRCAAASLAALLTTGLTFAADPDRRGEIGFDVGHMNFSSDVSDDSGALFGVRGGYHFNKWFQLEGQVASSKAEEQGMDATLSTLFVNSVFNFRARPNIRPYLLAGVGQANLEFDFGPVSVDDNGAAYQVGAGSRFFFGKDSRIAARVEASRLREKTFNDSSDYTNVVTGLTFKLGRKS